MRVLWNIMKKKAGMTIKIDQTVQSYVQLFSGF